MSRFCPMFSGSTGNSIYIGSADSHILVDVGVSLKSLTEAAARRGVDLSRLSGIVITHEHSDHIKGLSALLKKYPVTVVASSQTLHTLKEQGKIPDNVKTAALDCGSMFLGQIQVSRFATSHDCVGSSGYTFSLPDERKIAVCTDLGIVTEDVRNSISGCDLVMIESNHDITMLKKGPYPPLLKVRILSDSGHLSNHACAAELPALLNNGTTRFVLGHISLQNNEPGLAESAAVTALNLAGAKRGEDYILYVAPEKEGEIIYL